jgi:hypothetical protein
MRRDTEARDQTERAMRKNKANPLRTIFAVALNLCIVGFVGVIYAASASPLFA